MSELIRSNYQSIVQLIDDEERSILSLFAKSAGQVPAR